mgnify:CR=1 FL=1
MLTGSALTDVRFTLVAGRAHLKHTEGGDFRQATYRAVRQGLRMAAAGDGVQLLEPWYDFTLELPADALGRAKNIAPEIEFIHAREQDCHVLLDQLAAGEIPLRVTHNDTKINNVLIDAATGKGICVIDLDTVMPGLSAYDFGDSIRTGANDCAEDEPDQSKVHFDLHLYEVFAKGYLSTAGASMSMAEKKSLAWGARLMTLECGIRFLTDYLEGDHYFHIARPDHNLDRARTQFTLVRQMEEVFDQMLEIVCPDNH